MNAKTFKLLVTSAVALFSNYIILNCYSYAQVLPQDRRIDWRRAGVSGGIPDRTNIRNCVTSDGAHADGTNTAAQINACIANTPFGAAAYLPAGTYVVAASITIPSGKTLRGAGAESTIILSNTDMRAIVQIGQERGVSAAISISAGYTKGSTQLTVSDAGAISVGDYITVDELNDASIPVTNIGVGQCTWCGRSSGTRVRGQIVEVTAKTGNTLTIDPPMFFTFSSGNLPQIRKVYSVTEYAGVEDLTIKNGAGSFNQERTNLNMVQTANSWAKNIKIDTCGSRCIQLYYNNYRNEIRDSYITKCNNRVDSNQCYGTLVGAYTSGVLIENNIYDQVADGPMLAWGASGNVMSYNFIRDAHRTHNQTTWFTANGASHHGAHTAFNLWEGNEMESVYFDQYWGSHSHNVLFRNRITGKYMADGIADPNIQNVIAIATEKNVHYQSYLGNVLGTDGYHDVYERNGVGCPNDYYDKLIYRTGYLSSGDCSVNADPAAFNTMLRHLNYDYVSNSTKSCDSAGEPGCQGGDGENTLPESFYIPGKPTWFGSVQWPPIGPDVTGGNADAAGHANKIPARLCYENTVARGRPFTPADCYEDGAAPSPPKNLKIVED